MKKELEMYSNEQFAKNLKYLISNSGYDLKEISEKLQTYFGATISEKQLNKYLKGNATPKADNLYLLADFFGVSTDSLLGRCELSEYYIETDDPNFNKFHLDSNSRYKLSEMENETEINVLNKIISKSNLLDVFAEQLENATTQIETAPDKETKETITYIASCMLQREIDKLFRKCLTKYKKK